MSTITTHVLDLALGRPAKGIKVRLERRRGEGPYEELSAKDTDDDGRIRDLVGAEGVPAGIYRLTFEVGGYFESRGVATFYASVPIEFKIDEQKQHYHVPLLISPFGYSTYRGS